MGTSGHLRASAHRVGSKPHEEPWQSRWTAIVHVVQVWSADGKPLEAFYGVSEDIASAVYVPFTHSYWQVNRSGNVHAFDARAPAKITELVYESNGLTGQRIDRLFVPPHSDCLFASTQDRGMILYR